MNVFLVALGANLPLGEQTPADTLKKALKALENRGVRVESVSKLYQTPCFPPGAGPDYVNAAARLAADLTPAELLSLLHTVEREYGRERNVRWGMRTLDLDLIAAGTEIVPDIETFRAWQNLQVEEQKQHPPDQLILPHPRLQDRAFVLIPLRDVAPDWTHPVLDKTVAELCDTLSEDDTAEIKALSPLLA